MKLVWDESAWDDYVWWQTQDRKVLRRINTLIRDVERNGNEGIGKPEPLKHGFHGYWSRRITDEHRLVYKLRENEMRIAACRYQNARFEVGTIDPVSYRAATSWKNNAAEAVSKGRYPTS